MHTSTRRRRRKLVPMKLVARDALAARMVRKGFSNRSLAKYVECAPGTIDNLIAGRTHFLRDPKHAERICEALDVPLDVFFVPEMPSAARRRASQVPA